MDGWMARGVDRWMSRVGGKKEEWENGCLGG